MEKYNYHEVLKNDILNYIKEQNITGYIDEDLEEELDSQMLNSDSVTGNASGSYTFSSWKAEENLCHNIDLLGECANEFNMNMSKIHSAEEWDVAIRCYLLPSVLSEVIIEWNRTHNDEEDEDEEE